MLADILNFASDSKQDTVIVLTSNLCLLGHSDRFLIRSDCSAIRKTETLNGLDRSREGPTRIDDLTRTTSKFGKFNEFCHKWRDSSEDIRTKEWVTSFSHVWKSWDYIEMHGHDACRCRGAPDSALRPPSPFWWAKAWAVVGLSDPSSERPVPDFIRWCGRCASFRAHRLLSGRIAATSQNLLGEDKKLASIRRAGRRETAAPPISRILSAAGCGRAAINHFYSFFGV
ncbi:hypothetical protein EVAR_55454_1 [Eumeta japonica]|uniref:Uncharacterized protein n=1 Tax=Eumeta variegata TaxID=151549 RepID=A0A4C1Y567_EUMVA|nr:hypothetical protein EVAR_55454_1 [Eumeta japonica]